MGTRRAVLMGLIEKHVEATWSVPIPKWVDRRSYNLQSDHDMIPCLEIPMRRRETRSIL
jgi:hypothetical protein